VDADAVLLFRAVVAAAALTVGYLLTCRVFPYRRCRQCGGSGERKAPFGSSYAKCRRCGGTGGRLRLGRHIWDFLFR
jgi:DnaJ-class molecular chaperone